jgi:hypothetical protein
MTVADTRMASIYCSNGVRELKFGVHQYLLFSPYICGSVVNKYKKNGATTEACSNLVIWQSSLARDVRIVKMEIQIPYFHFLNLILRYRHFAYLRGYIVFNCFPLAQSSAS